MRSYREHLIFLLFQTRILAKPLWDKACVRGGKISLNVTHYFEGRQTLTSCTRRIECFDVVPESLIIL